MLVNGNSYALAFVDNDKKIATVSPAIYCRK